MQNLWDACLRRLERELPAQQFNTWIRPLAVDGNASDAGSLTLAAPNRFVLELVRERFSGRIEKLFSEEGVSAVSLKLVLARGADGAVRATPLPASPVQAKVPHSLERARLNPGFSFDSFVTGKANQLARAAAIQVSENPGISYNPLFVYGGVGLGKTPPCPGHRKFCRRAAARRKDPLYPRGAIRNRCRARLPAEIVR